MKTAKETLDILKAYALAADPGPRSLGLLTTEEAATINSASPTFVKIGDYDLCYLATNTLTEHHRDHVETVDKAIPEAKFIAKADPTTILNLIEDLEEANAMLAATLDALNRIPNTKLYGEYENTYALAAALGRHTLSKAL